MRSSNFQAAVTMTSRPRGFTMLEVLVSASVLAFAMLALVKMQTTAVQGNAAADRVTSAMFLAQGKMQELASLPFYFDTARLSEAAAPTVSTSLASGNEVTEMGSTSYTVTWSVNEPAAGDFDTFLGYNETWSARKLEVVVSYRDPMTLSGTAQFKLGPYMVMAEYR